MPPSACSRKPGRKIGRLPGERPECRFWSKRIAAARRSRTRTAGEGRRSRFDCQSRAADAESPPPRDSGTAQRAGGSSGTRRSAGFFNNPLRADPVTSRPEKSRERALASPADVNARAREPGRTGDSLLGRGQLQRLSPALRKPWNILGLHLPAAPAPCRPRRPGSLPSGRTARRPAEPPVKKTSVSACSFRLSTENRQRHVSEAVPESRKKKAAPQGCPLHAERRRAYLSIRML